MSNVNPRLISREGRGARNKNGGKGGWGWRKSNANSKT